MSFILRTMDGWPTQYLGTNGLIEDITQATEFATREQALLAAKAYATFDGKFRLRAEDADTFHDDNKPPVVRIQTKFKG